MIKRSLKIKSERLKKLVDFQRFNRKTHQIIRLAGFRMLQQKCSQKFLSGWLFFIRVCRRLHRLIFLGQAQTGIFLILKPSAGLFSGGGRGAGFGGSGEGRGWVYKGDKADG